jgi:hypothetical protein
MWMNTQRDGVLSVVRAFLLCAALFFACSLKMRWTKLSNFTIRFYEELWNCSKVMKSERKVCFSVWQCASVLFLSKPTTSARREDEWPRKSILRTNRTRTI